MINETSPPVVFIIIINWNGYEYSRACLTSLKNVVYPFQCIMVDNGSTDQSVIKLSNEFPNVTFIETGKNLGFTGGNNVGIGHALHIGADYILLLNNETIVANICLTPLINFMESDEQIAAVNPKIYFEDVDGQKNIIWAAGGEANLKLAKSNNRGRGRVDSGQFDSISTVSFATGCCLLMRATVIREIGLLTESYFAYFEDTDWSFRAKANGFSIKYYPHTHIWHAVGKSSQRKNGNSQKTSLNPLVHYLAARNQLWQIRKHSCLYHHQKG